jgi:hypothetical protein
MCAGDDCVARGRVGVGSRGRLNADDADLTKCFLTAGHWIGVVRAIRTGQLHGLPHFHTRPVNVMVFHGPRGELVWR